jgi:hypothetical protein
VRLLNMWSTYSRLTGSVVVEPLADHDVEEVLNREGFEPLVLQVVGRDQMLDCTCRGREHPSFAVV